MLLLWGPWGCPELRSLRLPAALLLSHVPESSCQPCSRQSLAPSRSPGER